MKDQLVKALSSNGHIRILCATTTNLCEQARVSHGLWPTSCAALGRVLTVTAIMGGMLKDDKEKVVVQLNGGGPIGTIMAEGRPNGNVKGFVQDPEQFLQYNESKKLAVGLVVGTDGYLNVVKDLGMKEEFTGQVALQTGEIGDDFAYYFTVSEQTPSAVSVGVLIDTDNSVISAGGLIIQLMPDAEEEDILFTEDIVSKLRPISDLVNEKNTAEDIIKMYFEDAKILETSDLQWHCGCSKERFAAGLSTLEVKDLQDMIDEDHGAQIVCQYCNKQYDFSEDDLKEVLEFKKNHVENR